MKRLAVLLVLVLMAQYPAQADTSPSQPERTYFVMLDRFANGDTSNDFGGKSSAQAGGFDPSDAGFWHGGDFKGLTEKLNYIKGLGFTSVWVSPIVRNQTLAVDGRSAGYHGYWGLGFDETDPHFGTKAEFIAMVHKAHDLGLKIILDIVVNHTGDVINLDGGSLYIGSSVFPYKTCGGAKFDAVKLSGTSAFPTLDQLCPKVSFPKEPVATDPSAKSPSWLNDVRLYHNRGNSTFDGESSQWGDFYGLDDLFTENPVVVDGLTRLWSTWIKETGIDGLRIDTARHVNEGFWKTFIPAVRALAAEQGKKDFPIWGEVYDANPLSTAYWSVEGGLTGVLDFAFQDRVTSFVGQGSAEALADLFNYDDYYITSKFNPNTFGTFLDNHDMDRVASLLNLSRVSQASALQSLNLSYATLFLLRGSPIVYYGDEFGLFGGPDKASRQDLFPTQVNSWRNEIRVGGAPIGSGSSFDTTNPLQQTISTFNALRTNYPILGTGAQEVLIAERGLFVAKRFDPRTSQQVLVVLNAADTSRTAQLPSASWQRIAGDGALSMQGKMAVPARSWAVYSTSLGATKSQPSVSLMASNKGSELKGRLLLQARVAKASVAEVEFFAKIGAQWQSLGVDSSRTFASNAADSGWFRVFPIRSQYKVGSKVAFKAVARTPDGKQATSLTKTLIITK